MNKICFSALHKLGTSNYQVRHIIRNKFSTNVQRLATLAYKAVETL